VSDEEISELRGRVRRLEDREELRDLVARYGRAVDDRDWASLADQYTQDAVFDSAKGRSVGIAAIVDYYRARTDEYVASYHYPHSHEITFVDDDMATGLVCAHAELTIGGETIWVALRYHDDYRRVDGGWRFHERVTRLLYVLKLSELPNGFADRMRVRWPGLDPAPAEIGADIEVGRTTEPS
jgi:ketosteroid isomerase-like protein